MRIKLQVMGKKKKIWAKLLKKKKKACSVRRKYTSTHHQPLGTNYFPQGFRQGV